nr:extensin-like [Arachis hypogaea]
MRKKTVIQKGPRAKILKLPEKPRPSTRSQDQTSTPSPYPPTSPPRTVPMVRTKNPSRFPSSSKPTAPPSAPSKPSTSKGKHPAAEEPVPEPTRSKPRSAPSRPQRVYPVLVKEFYANMTYHEGTIHSYVKGRDLVLNNETISDSLKYIDVGACAYTSSKWDERGRSFLQ